MKNRKSRKLGDITAKTRMTHYIKEARILKALDADELADIADGVVPERLKLVIKPHDFVRDFAAEMSEGGPTLRLAADKILRGRVSLALWELGRRELPRATKFLVKLVLASE